jgi:hypothetical protein
VRLPKHRYEDLLRELLEAQRNGKSERLSKEQLALFEAAWQARHGKMHPYNLHVTNSPGSRRTAGAVSHKVFLALQLGRVSALSPLPS